ncbi:MAG: CvpA family protein [Bacteroidales bacterium]|nr:CvpA family protein [Bacteroidales bacterium]
MNFLDIIIAIPLGWLIFKGYRRGLIFEAVALLSVIFGSFLAVRFANWFSSLVGLTGPNAYLISFFVIFVLVIVLSLFVAKLAERFVKLMHVGIFNNLAGALLGLVKGLCIVGVLLYYTAVIDLNERLLSRNTKESSMLYKPVERSGKHIAGRMEAYLNQRKQIHEQQEIR